MMRGGTILWVGLAAIAGAGLFLLKYEVQTEEERLDALRRDIVRTEEDIHVLNAEWSYLNDPGRLREQAEYHLGFHPLKPDQIITIASLPMAERRVANAPMEPPAGAAPNPAGEEKKATATTTPAPSLPPIPSRPAVAPAPRPVVTAKEHNSIPPKPPAAKIERTASVASAPHPKALPRQKEAPQTRNAAVAKPASPHRELIASAKIPERPAAPETRHPAPRHQETPVVSTPPARPAVASVSQTTVGSRNVMVITSPALLQPELASARTAP